MANEYKYRRKIEKRAAAEAESARQEAARAEGMRCMFESLPMLALEYCNECGAVVYDREVHYDWHQKV